LNVGVDNTTLDIYNKIVRVRPGGIGATQIDPTQVQLRVNGAAGCGSFLQSINQDGSVNTGTVWVNNTLTRYCEGDLYLGIALGHPNTWTGFQTFAGGADASMLTVDGATMLNGTTNTGLFTNNGDMAVNGGTTLSGTTNNGVFTNNGFLFNNGSMRVTGNEVVFGLTSLITGSNTTTLTVNNQNPSGSNVYAARILTGGERGLRVQCRTQSGSSLSSNTHFIDFYDGSSVNWRGSIQGQSYAEYWNDPINIALAVTNGVQIASGITATASAIASAASVFAAAAAAGIAASAASFIAQTVQYGTVTGIQSGVNLGVAYTSSSGDYAEYLRRADPNEALYPGDVVGMTNGLISKNTAGAQNILSISMAPIVLGNIPPKGQEQAFNKVAFLGQVPVKVRGAVHEGDFIIASGLNDGIAVAVSAQDITPEQFTQVLGRAWTSSADAKLKYIKVAVGLNAKSMSEIMSREENEINVLKQQVIELRKTNGEVAILKAKLDRIEQALIHGTDQNTREVKLTNN